MVESIVCMHCLCMPPKEPIAVLVFSVSFILRSLRFYMCCFVRVFCWAGRIRSRADILLKMLTTARDRERNRGRERTEGGKERRRERERQDGEGALNTSSIEL